MKCLEENQQKSQLAHIKSGRALQYCVWHLIHFDPALCILLAEACFDPDLSLQMNSTRFLIPTIIRFPIAHIRDGGFTSRKWKCEAEYDVDFVLVFLFFLFCGNSRKKWLPELLCSVFHYCLKWLENPMCCKRSQWVFYRVLQSEVL